MRLKLGAKQTMISAPMKTKVAALVLTLLAIAGIATTLILQGHPLGYRGRQAVIHAVVGSSELRVGLDRPERGKPGAPIGFDTEIRTSSYSSVYMVAPSGTIRVFDSSSLRTRKKKDPAAPGWRLSAGRVEIEVDSDDGLTVGPQGSAAYVELLPGAYVLTADGQGLMAGTCLEGTLLIHEGEGRPTEVQVDQVFVMTPMAPVFVSDSVPPMQLEAQLNPAASRGERATVTGQVTPGGRVYVNGEISFPNSSGEFVTAISPSDKRVVVIAEDLLGNAVRKELMLTAPEIQR